MKNVAKFMKVSFKEFNDSYFNTFPDSNNESFDLQLCYDNIKLPKRATIGSAGYDFFSPIDFSLKPMETIKIPTGIRCKMNNDIVLMIFPRSSLGFKYRLTLNNTVGIVDSDYYNSDNEGHIFIKITNLGDKNLEIKSGSAFAQGILLPYFTAEDDDVKEVRNGGMGSTNK